MTHENLDDLEYTADGIRDRANELGRSADEQRVQASMQEETAKAIYALRDAVKELSASMPAEQPEAEAPAENGLYVIGDTPPEATPVAVEGGFTDLSLLIEVLNEQLTDSQKRDVIGALSV